MRQCSLCVPWLRFPLGLHNSRWSSSYRVQIFWRPFRLSWPLSPSSWLPSWLPFLPSSACLLQRQDLDVLLPSTSYLPDPPCDFASCYCLVEVAKTDLAEDLVCHSPLLVVGLHGAQPITPRHSCEQWRI